MSNSKEVQLGLPQFGGIHIPQYKPPAPVQPVASSPVKGIYMSFFGYVYECIHIYLYIDLNIFIDISMYICIHVYLNTYSKYVYTL